jgi:predicted ATPase
MSAAYGGQVLLSQITRELVLEHLPESVSTKDLGRHRLKDLSRPEHIFQLVSNDFSSTFPPLRSLDVTPISLPVQTTPFVGREEEIASLSDLLAQTDTRLVTLVGPGGAGKTRLAIEIAAQHGAKFRQGVFFVDLAPLSAAEQIVQAVIEALSIAITSGDDLDAQLLRYLRRKNLLLVIDNFEQVLNGAPLVNGILRAAPSVTVLATSREKLNLTGESVLAVGGLQFADWRTPDEVMAHSAGQLFVQSAQRAQPGFQLNIGDVPHLARICQLVEGMPLAILLAAAWADMLSPQEIAAEIADSLDFLETELRDIPARQRSIRAVFEGSWERLAPADRELFKTLSVFRGGFTRQAAGEAAGASLRALAGLVSKSFLRRDPEWERYEIHELLRQFAVERLEATPEASWAAREAHTVYFTGLVEKMLDELRSDRQKAALDAIEADIENVRSAWRQLAAGGRAAEMNRIIETLWYFHEIRGWYHAGLDLFWAAEEKIRASGGDQEIEVVTSQVRVVRGYYTTLLGFAQQGRELIEESAATLRRLDRRKERLVSLSGLGASSFFLNRGAEALEISQEALDIATEIGDSWWEAHSYSGLGAASMAVRAFEDARRYSERAASLWDRIGDPWGSIWPGQTLGGLATIRGNYAEARDRYQQVLETAQSVNFRRGLQYTYNNLGNVSFWLEDYREAEEYFLQSLSNSYEIGHTREILATLYDIARVRASAQQASEAVVLLAVILQHPAREQHGLLRPATIQEDAEQLRIELETALAPEEYAAAWGRGQAAELDAVVAEMLA